ncbi:MAG: hypothetical protein PHF97_09455 [Bacteroidales bacterium]|nr:hypothetical protein [Bacteroidales bacterium]MDD4604017.1 hypothetical protein [Bacteroidales bacterium]
METHPDFDKYMDRYYDYLGQWDSPSKCGLKIINRNDGKLLVIATEIYRLNPGTPVTEWCAPLATRILKEFQGKPDHFLFIEHTPDLHSKLTFYGETFDLVKFEWNGESFFNPQWTRLSPNEVEAMMHS